MPFLNEEEVRQFLGVKSEDLEKLIKRGKLTAYRLGGSFLRFDKEEVLALKSGRKYKPVTNEFERSAVDKVIDFWKFHSFYVFSLILILLLIILFCQF